VFHIVSVLGVPLPQRSARKLHVRISAYGRYIPTYIVASIINRINGRDRTETVAVAFDPYEDREI